MRFFDSLPFALNAWCHRDQSFFVSPTSCAQWKKKAMKSQCEALETLHANDIPSLLAYAESDNVEITPALIHLLTAIPTNAIAENEFQFHGNTVYQALFYQSLIKAQRLAPNEIESLAQAYPDIKRGVLLSALEHQVALNWSSFVNDPEVNDIAWVARARRGQAVIELLKQQIDDPALTVHALAAWYLLQPDAFNEILSHAADPTAKVILCVYSGDLNVFSDHAHHLISMDLNTARECVNALLNIHPEVRQGMHEASKVQPIMIDVQALRKVIEHQFNHSQVTLWGQQKTPERIDFIAREAGGKFSQYCKLAQVVKHAAH